MSAYIPGLHIVSSFSCPLRQLQEHAFCKQVFDSIIEGLSLQKVGEVYHAFPQGGYTAVVCLTESHVSIHTWPEFQLATFDVFLSNFQNNNTDKVREFFKQTIKLFGATILSQQEISR